MGEKGRAGERDGNLLGEQYPERLQSLCSDRQDKLLSDYQGKVLLIMNIASQRGFMLQYQGLEMLSPLSGR